MPYQKPRFYWQFTALIMREPHISLHRCVFADELDGVDMYRAARKQREYAKLIDKAWCIWRVYDARRCDIMNPPHVRKQKNIIKVFGIVKRGQSGRFQQFEIKPDGTIVLSPAFQRDTVPETRRGFKIFKGELPKRLVRRVRFNVVGTLTGRTASSNPNVPGTSDSEGRGGIASRVRGTPDSIRDGTLFDFRTVRAHSERIARQPLVEADFQGIELRAGDRRIVDNSLRARYPNLSDHQLRILERAMGSGEPGMLYMDTENTGLGKVTAGMEVTLPVKEESLANRVVRNEAYKAASANEQRMLDSVLATAVEKNWQMAKTPLVVEDTREGWEQAMTAMLNGEGVGIDMTKARQLGRTEGTTRQLLELQQRLMDDLEAECFNPDLGIPHEVVPSVIDPRQDETSGQPD